YFSRIRRHTRCLSDWSSDVCASDLLWRGLVESIARDLRHISAVSAEVYVPGPGRHPIPYLRVQWDQNQLHIKYGGCAQQLRDGRSEERRVGKEVKLARYEIK